MAVQSQRNAAQICHVHSLPEAVENLLERCHVVEVQGRLCNMFTFACPGPLQIGEGAGDTSPHDRLQQPWGRAQGHYQDQMGTFNPITGHWSQEPEHPDRARYSFSGHILRDILPQCCQAFSVLNEESCLKAPVLCLSEISPHPS